MKRTQLLLSSILICGIWLFHASVAHAQFSADYQTNVISGVISNWAGSYIIGSNTVFDLLRIENGGVLSSANSYIGYETTASNNVAIVSGSGSVWSNSGTLYIGYSSAGDNLTISNGATVLAQAITAGNLIGSQGTLTMADGTLTVLDGWTTIGNQGAGNLVISNGLMKVGSLQVVGTASSAGAVHLYGGTLSVSSRLQFGSEPGATASVWVTGGQLLLTNGFQEVHLGGGCAAQMTISNGIVNAFFLRVGDGNVGTLTVAGGTLDMNGVLELAASTNAAVWITGGQINDGSLLIGAGADASVFVSNGVVRSPLVRVGWRAGGAGTLTVAGGTVDFNSPFPQWPQIISEFHIGGRPWATGVVWVTGGQIIGTNTLYVGGTNDYLLLPNESGYGQMSISNGTVAVGKLMVGALTRETGCLSVAGGEALAGDLLIGAPNCDSTGTVTITGGTLYVTNGTISVGSGGVGEMKISDGAVLANTITVASNATARGTLTVAGGQVSFAGGTSQISRLNLGYSANATGTVWLTGGQLTAATNTFTTIGVSGVGQMTVSNGHWEAGTVTLAASGGSQGTLTIAGGTQSLSSLNVGGNSATGTVWLTGGQLTVSNDTLLGAGSNPGGVGQMTVSNGTWEVGSANVGFGLGARGTLTVAGGTVTVLESLFIGNSPDATGTTWLTGGQLTVTNRMTWIGMVGAGRMIVSNGTWLALSVVIPQYVALGGFFGSGTLTVAGGTSSIYSNLTIGNFSCTVTGAAMVAGGTLAVTNASHTAVLEVCSGTLTQTGGTLLIDTLVMTNACGHFVHAGGTLIYGSAVLDPARDDDGDGLPNGWEQSHGLDPLTPNADADSDGDGQSNLAEYLSGTDPTNSASSFRITSLVSTDHDVLVTWAMGNGKTNALQASAGDAGGGFTNTFSDIYTVTNTIGTTTNYLDDGAATSFPSRFYRVRLVP